MSQSQFTILIVDDNRANLRILGATFEDHGFSVHSASGVEEAQQLLSSHPDTIDIVLSDIQMPGLSGFDLLQWMKAGATAIQDIPLLLITSQLPEAEHRIRGLSLGAVDYLIRSLDPEELVLRVTQAIRHFKQTKLLKHSLETTENIAATGRLFAASNHEIKNVAQIIRMASGILEREMQKANPSETTRQAVGMLQRSSSLLADMTKMIGSIVGTSEAAMGPTDLDTLVDQVASMVKPLLKGQIELHWISSGSAWVWASPVFVQQVLLNLILNARDAIDESKSQTAGTIKIAMTTADGIELTVTDSGVGFPSQETRTEFQPFASTKQLRGGSGLGLWLSSHLMQKMGGRLTLSSRGLGQGAEARLVFKKAEDGKKL